MSHSPLHTAQHLYFLGIGGIGMSALAWHFLRQGKRVRGYDRTDSPITRQLERAGVAIDFDMEPGMLAGQELLIYTPAVSPDSLAFEEAKVIGLPMMKRAAVLGELSRAYRTLAVAGTHGKTSTSTLLAHLLQVGGLAPTAFLGGIAKNFASNFLPGTSEWMVVEADEFDRSFLHLQPEMAAITSLDPDHLDIYGTAEAMQATYWEFGRQCQQVLVHASLASQPWGREVQTFGIETGDFQAQRLRAEGLQTTFDLVGPDWRVQDLSLPLPGRHNVLNFIAAAALAVYAGMDPAALKTAAASFAGIQRRFEVQLDHPQLSYVDDYAHHPAELEAAIAAAKAHLPGRQVVVVFQPHLYSRTRDFFRGFASALDLADRVLLMDIYPAREAPLAGVDSELILRHMAARKQVRLVKRATLEAELMAVIKPPAVLLTLGAGDIDREVTRLKHWAENYVTAPA